MAQKFLKKIVFSSAALIGLMAAAFLLLPAVFGPRFTGACVKNILLQPRLDGAPSKLNLLRALFSLEIAERLKALGIDKEPVATIGDYAVRFTTYFSAKSVFSEVFVDREYAVKMGCGAEPYIFDCGANVGTSTLFFKMLFPGATITSFEPDPLNIQYFKSNMQANNIQGVTLVEHALYERETTLNFKAMGSVGSKLVGEDVEGVIQVKAVPLSPFIDRPIDLLKMDIEGAEVAVLDEVDRAGKFPFIKRLIMEFHYSPVDDNSLSKLIAILEKHNFAIKVYSSRGSAYPINSDKQNPNELLLLMIFAYKKNGML